MLCVTFLAQCVVTVMLSGLACWFLFYFFLFKDNRSLQLQKWCVLWAGSIAWYIEKKKVVILLAGCKHLCDRHCAQSLSADTGKNQLLMFQQTLEVHIIALNFYDTWLCHIFMDKCNDGCPQKKKKKNIFYDKMSKEINWIVRKWLIVL